MAEHNEVVPSVEVEIAPEDSMNLLESFEYASNQLKNLRERMEQSDRALYRTIGAFVDSTDRTVQNLATEALDLSSDNFLSPTAIEPSQEELKQLHNRHQTLQTEINSLLLTAYSNQEIDRLRNLEYLTSLISARIQELSDAQTQIEPNSPHKSVKTVDVDELKARFSSLSKAKEFYNIKANSWQGLVDKLNTRS